MGRLEDIIAGRAAPKGFHQETKQQYETKEYSIDPDDTIHSDLHPAPPVTYIRTPICNEADCHDEITDEEMAQHAGFCEKHAWQCPRCEQWMTKPETDYLCKECRGY